jgi:GT2 family glycosyltransferase
MIIKDISVIIPTYCRKEPLIKVIECLSRQTINPKEVFIIDSSPVDQRLDSYEISKLPSWAIYKICDDIKNIPWKRNMVIPLCIGEIIIFLDDDVSFEATLIEDYIFCFSETGADGISGLVLLSDENESNKPVLNDEGWMMDIGPNIRNIDHILKTKVICTANFSIKRNVILDVGGFDEQMRGTWDDTELGYRLSYSDYDIIHHPRPKVIHFKSNFGGTREKGVDLKFNLTNIFYFHMKHSKKYPSYLFFLTAFWKYCRPGLRWINIRFMFKQCLIVLRTFNEAKNRISEGPILLSK